MKMHEDKHNESPRVIVCQHGARRRYAVPRMLEEAGMLAALYTDSSACSFFGRIALALNKIGVRHRSLNAFAARKPTGIPRKKIFSTDRALLLILKGAPWFDLSATFQKRGLQGSNVVYSMCGEDLGFLAWAKSQGAKIIIDVFVHPLTARLVAEEKLRVRETPMDMDLINDVEEHFRRSLDLGDILLCPSGWVADGVRRFSPDYEKKVRVVPYGSSLSLSKDINPAPVKGRILFAGRKPLRKGLHYLAAAATALRKQGMEIDIHIAGLTADEVDWIEDKNELHCLGTIPMSRMREEFKQADVFVLPSLSEGQAGVVLEAMACGCPVVATWQSGVDLDPEAGVMVPAGDADALAAAIMKVLESREIRNNFARNALKQSEMFSAESWKKRLVDMIADVVSNDGKE